MKKRQREPKICCECGSEIQEKVESIHTQCERCIGRDDEHQS